MVSHKICCHENPEIAKLLSYPYLQLSCVCVGGCAYVCVCNAAADRGVSKSRSGDGQDISHPDPFLSARPAKMQHKGLLH